MTCLPVYPKKHPSKNPSISLRATVFHFIQDSSLQQRHRRIQEEILNEKTPHFSPREHLKASWAAVTPAPSGMLDPME